jgi:phosphate transport system protein
MDKTQLGQHISQQFNHVLEDVRNRVMAMGGLVEQQLSDALRSLSDIDAELAEVVITNDYKINALEVAIDEECLQILARRQPAANDLRLVMAVIKTITELERIGDEAERISRMALHFVETGGESKMLVGIDHLGEHVRTMLHDALDAFARMDIDAAIRVAKRDAKADREYEKILQQLVTYMMEDSRAIPSVLDVMWSARALERIGDRARNICEYVIYLVKGRDVRHISLDRVEARVKQ